LAFLGVSPLAKQKPRTLYYIPEGARHIDFFRTDAENGFMKYSYQTFYKDIFK